MAKLVIWMKNITMICCQRRHVVPKELQDGPLSRHDEGYSQRHHGNRFSWGHENSLKDGHQNNL